MVNIFTNEYNELGNVLSQEITFKTSKSYSFSNVEYIPILQTNYFKLIPLCKKVNEMNEKRSA